MQFIPARESPPAAIRSRGELPHLYKPGGTYFVTFRLADAVLPPTSKATAPRPGMEISSGWDDVDPEELLAAHDPPITLGSCLLRDRRIASVTRQAMLHFRALVTEMLSSGATDVVSEIPVQQEIVSGRPLRPGDGMRDEERLR